jgi:hypothetical protein
VIKSRIDVEDGQLAWFCGESTTSGRSFGQLSFAMSFGGPFESSLARSLVPFPFSPMPCQKIMSGYACPSPYVGGRYSQ